MYMILSQTSPLKAPQWGSKIPSLKECLNLYSSVLKRRFWRWKTLEPSFRLQKKHFLPQLIEKKQPARKPLKPCLSCGHHLAISKLANECGAQVLKLCHHMCMYILADSVLIQSLHLIVFKRKSPGTEKPHCPQKMPLCGQPKVNLEKLICKARNLSNKPGSSFQAKPPNTIRLPLFQPSTQQVITGCMVIHCPQSTSTWLKVSCVWPSNPGTDRVPFQPGSFQLNGSTKWPG